jgi:hypothetical protein
MITRWGPGTRLPGTKYGLKWVGILNRPKAKVGFEHASWKSYPRWFENWERERETWFERGHFGGGSEGRDVVVGFSFFFSFSSSEIVRSSDGGGEGRRRGKVNKIK